MVSPGQSHWVPGSVPKGSDSAFIFHLSPALYLSFLRTVKCRGTSEPATPLQAEGQVHTSAPGPQVGFAAFSHPVQLCKTLFEELILMDESCAQGPAVSLCVILAP